MKQLIRVFERCSHLSSRKRKEATHDSTWRPQKMTMLFLSKNHSASQERSSDMKCTHTCFWQSYHDVCTQIFFLMKSLTMIIIFSLLSYCVVVTTIHSCIWWYCLIIVEKREEIVSWSLSSLSFSVCFSHFRKNNKESVHQIVKCIRLSIWIECLLPSLYVCLRGLAIQRRFPHKN